MFGHLLPPVVVGGPFLPDASSLFVLPTTDFFCRPTPSPFTLSLSLANLHPQLFGSRCLPIVVIVRCGFQASVSSTLTSSSRAHAGITSYGFSSISVPLYSSGERDKMAKPFSKKEQDEIRRIQKETLAKYDPFGLPLFTNDEGGLLVHGDAAITDDHSVLQSDIWEPFHCQSHR